MRTLKIRTQSKDVPLVHFSAGSFKLRDGILEHIWGKISPNIGLYRTATQKLLRSKMLLRSPVADRLLFTNSRV